MSKKIKESDIQEALQTLKKYKASKATLEARIVEDELFWKRCHWEQKREKGEKHPASGWLFNAIINRHADAMDNYPEAVMLPREESDKQSAEILTSIMPVIFDQNGFRKTYSDAWWYKLKHGVVAYGVFWNGQVDEGRGSVEIRRLDILNLFWEPGITDIQKSRNLFVCDLVATDTLKEKYPGAKISGGEETELKKYVYDDSFDTSDKALVVDWYYKKNGKLHFCKFCEDNILFASENEKGYDNGWYEDGRYPVEFETLYPEDGTPVGFGMVSICKDAQTSIDIIDDSAMENMSWSSKPRYFKKHGAGINVEEFMDKSNQLVEVEGEINEERIRQIEIPEFPRLALEFRTAKINELKETSGNTDFVQGNTSKGVTSGAAIAVLQEAGNKLSRDSIGMAHETFKNIVYMVIERIRQFYDIKRTFRITAPNNEYEFREFDNSQIKVQPGAQIGGQEIFRKPIFDIVVHAQKKNPFSTLSQNETASNLFGAGFFNPQMAQQAMIALKLMTFEGKDEVEKYIQEGATLQNQLVQAQQQNEQLMQQLQILQGGIAPGLPEPAISSQVNVA